MARGWEAAHVHPDLGDEHLRSGVADPGDLIQPVGRLSERGDRLLDPGLHRGDVGGCLVDAAKHPFQQEGVMVAEAAAQGDSAQACQQSASNHPPQRRTLHRVARMPSTC
jgi:hypothetical protein